MTQSNTRADALTHLLPCAFCGCTKTPIRQGNGIGDFWLECSDCGASTRLREDGAGSEKDWNRRPDMQPAAAPIEDDDDSLALALASVDPCPFCGSENVDPKGWLANDGRSGPACDDCGATAESVEGWNRRVPAPSPADERAAFESAMRKPLTELSHVHCMSLSSTLPGQYACTETEYAWRAWQARAASANETGAEVVTHLKECRWCPDECPVTGKPFFMWIAHPELGYVPTYGGPFDSYTIAAPDEDGHFRSEHYDHDEGTWIEGGAPMRVRRELVVAADRDVAPAMAAEAVAWVRKHPDTGELSGDWLWNDVIEQCRKDSGVWYPLGFLGARPALPEEPAAIHQVIHQVWVEETSSWADVTPAYYAERQPSNRRRVYYAPQPAQADARVGLADSDVFTLIGHAELLRGRGETDMPAWCLGLAHRIALGIDEALAARVEALATKHEQTAAHPGQPEPRAEVTGVQWWLAELDQHGNPKLSDGAHSERAGADRAIYLIKHLGLDTKGKRWAVARVELSEPRPRADGVDEEAMNACRTMVDAARAGGSGD